jgi:hypothetical protein
MSMTRLLAATLAALMAMAMALAGCSDSGASVEVTGVGGEPYEAVPGETVGEVFADGPCADWQDIEGEIIRYTFAYGEDSGVPWLSDERVAGDYEYLADVDFQEEGDTCVGYFSGTETMTNDNGTWEGTVEGTMTGVADTQVHSWEYDLTGTMSGSGDYDGLQYTYNLQGTTHPWDLTGTISPS